MTSSNQKMSQTKAPPNTDEILKQFRLPVVRLCGAVVMPFLRGIKIVRRVSWEVRGLEHVTKSNKPYLFASNHQSHIDTHVILDVIPKSIRKQTAAAAAFDHFADHEGTSLRKRILHFLVSSVWNAFAIERVNSPLRSIRTMQALLSKGWSILIYPEGTRSRNGEIAPFKAGLAIVAKKSGRPVIPICIQGGSYVLPEATYIPKRGIITVSFGKPLQFEKDDSAETFMLRIEQAVRKMASE